MKTKNDFKRFLPHILGGTFLLILLVLFGIFDLTIALSFDTYINWFTIFFDMWGMQAVIIPIGITIIFLTIAIGYLIKRDSNQLLKTSLIGLCIDFVIIAIYESIKYENFFVHNGSFKDKITMASTIFILLVIVLTLIGTVVLVNTVQVFKENEYMSKLWINVLYAVFLLIITTIIVSLFKVIWGRPRPNSILENTEDFKYLFEINFGSSRGKSFPSGHTQAAGLFLVLVYFLPNVPKKKIFYYSITTFSIISMILTGASRVAYHKHFPSDVTFAFILVIIFFIATPKIFQFKQKNND